MKAKLFLTTLLVLALSPIANADFTVTVTSASIDDIQSFGGRQQLSPTGDYFVSPILSNAVDGLFFASTAVPTDSTFNNGGEVIAPDLLGGSIVSSDVTLENPDGSFNTILIVSSSGGDLGPAGFAGGSGAALDSLGVFYGDVGFGTPPIDFGDGVVNSAFFDAVDASGASLIGGAVDLVALGFDVQSGSFFVDLGPGTTGLGISATVLDLNVSKAIPEPTSFAVLGMLGIGLVARRRR